MSAVRPTSPLGALLVSAENIAGAGIADPAGSPRIGEDAFEPRIACQPGQTLAQAIYLSGHFAPPALCSGLATCGRCRVRVTDGRPDPVPAEQHIFSPEEITEGWRLACRHQPAPGMRVELPDEARPFAAPLAGNAAEPAGGPMKGENAFLAVDLGTTSLEWLLFTPLAQGIRILWQGKTVNPQMGAGSDLISRLAAAGHGQRLGALTREALRILAEKSAAVMRAHGLSGAPTLCLAANTAMTAITLDADTAGLARAPYSLPYAGGQWENPPGLPRTWIPPQLSPFVGGDIAAGYAALALDPDRPTPDYPFLLADLGTNGEFLLALAPDKALAASVALGPALEGIGLTHGTEARPGAITDFSLGLKGLEARRLPASGPDSPAPGAPAPDAFPSSSTGITGTGYLALLRLLLASGAMDSQGHFTPDYCGPLKRFLSPEKAGPTGIPGDGDWLPLPLSLRLTARDVEEILKVKAAFSLGLRRLLAKAGLAFRDLAGVRIAGALGSHVNKQALEHLGFFPPGAENRLEAVGNTSLAGAALLLRNPDARPALVRWAATVETLDLATDPGFTQNFTAHMRFVW